MPRRSASSTSTAKKVMSPRPSSSVVLLSPHNQVLLLHRVKTSTSFASAHVFPGGNLDPYHDGDIPEEGSEGRHRDGLAYRIGAIRETFEETGILLAKKKNGDGLVEVQADEREGARKRIHGNQIRFTDWVDSIGGTLDTDGLVPWTRWITPTNVPKRFTTQMYLYLLPLASSLPSEMLVPTPDDGVEHTAATFAPAQEFLARQQRKEIIMFPPQAYLAWHLTRFISDTATDLETSTRQRQALLDYIHRVPTGDSPRAREHATSQIAWGDKVMSPHNLFIRESDGRIVLGLDKPGPELKGSGRGGDWEHVVYVRFAKGGPTEVEIKRREEALREEKEFKAQRESKL
ncbi:uncharacterized protein F5Z01DRAFT_670840 [Emericellopsis atlantica]|uniref:Nudix hydrolase domain-containing protein n=1 Tax=Emericellopsis atlantica TaxID=2614577 RepID=A0A9P7ZUY9_9HYPO|nr:uncharacterized protein F5Z01DRAFT_670840 [Emericellopsis atlantica]KAG9258185.1 hypothetical protein F5Z01DRAFT_670840 [Emericellopsis atlantica]